MQVWVDADACPKDIKEILFRAANRCKIDTIFVSNKLLQTPPSFFIKTVRVGAGFDVADNHIIQHAQIGDLVITADIPLANAAIEKGASVLNTSGEFYTKANIKQKLAIRNLHTELRESGVIKSRTSKLSKKENQLFASCLDSFLARCSP